MERVVIGYSDYTRDKMEKGTYKLVIGVSAEYFLSTIYLFEENGYEVKFQTSFWSIFWIGKYKVVAYKK